MQAAPVHSGSSLLSALLHRYYGLAGTHGDLDLQGKASTVKHKELRDLEQALILK